MSQVMLCIITFRSNVDEMSLPVLKSYRASQARLACKQSARPYMTEWLQPVDCSSLRWDLNCGGKILLSKPGDSWSLVDMLAEI